MSLDIKNLCFSYGDKLILNNITLSFSKGEIVSVLGQNGVGKTTLFKCILGFLNYNTGTVTIDGENIKTLTKRDISKKIAYIPQSFNPVFNHSVLDCILMGYAGSVGVFEKPSKQQVQRAMEILGMLGIQKLADKSCLKISGGEKSLMLIGRALVQGADIILMDEPTANLDFANTKSVMSIIKTLSDKGCTVIFTTHDPNNAVNFSSRIIALKEGSVFADIKPETVSEKTLSSLYGIKIEQAQGFRVSL